ncbi:MAG: hypothetical protein ABSD29_07995 [Verrucomicrobiota bacterium]
MSLKERKPKLKCWPKGGNGPASDWSNGCKRKPGRQGRFSPLRQRQTRRLTLHTVVGKITVVVDYGRERGTGKWVCPAREGWGLGAHQKMTPELEDRVCLTATLTGSYQAAAELSAIGQSSLNPQAVFHENASVRLAQGHPYAQFAAQNLVLLP